MILKFIIFWFVLGLAMMILGLVVTTVFFVAGYVKRLIMRRKKHDNH